MLVLHGRYMSVIRTCQSLSLTMSGETTETDADQEQRYQDSRQYYFPRDLTATGTVRQVYNVSNEKHGGKVCVYKVCDLNMHANANILLLLF